MVAVNLIILFEAFNKDFLLEVYQYNPELLKNKEKTLSSKQILKFKSIKKIIHLLASPRGINLSLIHDIFANAIVIIFSL